MSYARLGLIISAALLSSPAVFAGGDPDDRLAALEKRLAYLEQRIKSQDAVIAQKDEALSKLTGSALGRTELFGVIEMSTADTQGSGTAGQVDKVELTLSTEINENISSEIVLLSEYEASADNNYPVNIDTAAVTFTIPDTEATITTGKFGHSFASLESVMVTDPLTKEEGDVSSNMGVELATDLNGVGITLAGTADGQAAATVSVGGETADMEYSVNAGYINELANSTTVGGYTVGTTLTMAGITMNAEYLEADDKVSGETHEINASHIDFSADMGLGTAFIGYGETRNGSGVTTDQTGVGYHYGLGDGVTLSYEHLDNTDNNDVDTLKLAIEF